MRPTPPSPTPRRRSPRRARRSTPPIGRPNTELRIRCLEQFHRALVDHRDELAALTIAEVGATGALCQGAQLDQPIAIVAYYADLLKTYAMTEDLGNIESRGMQHHRWVEKEAGGRGRRDHRLQLSEPARTGQAGARAGRRLHGGPQGPRRTPR